MFRMKSGETPMVMTYFLLEKVVSSFSVIAEWMVCYHKAVRIDVSKI